MTTRPLNLPLGPLVNGAGEVLFCCAHPSEAKALPSGLNCLVTGVGKVPAAAALARHLASAPKASIGGVFIFGVAGVYPAKEGHFRPELGVGEPVWLASDALIDEGVTVDDGFLDLDTLDLRGQSPARYDADSGWLDALHAKLVAPRVLGATVSSCSGTDELALSRVRLQGAEVETMEGAALAHCAMQEGLPWAQLRVISNRCGKRSSAGWDLPLSITRLRESLLKLVA